MKISIVIPAYNEENAIGNVLADIRENFKGQDYEIIVIDDCSDDKTAQILRKEKDVILITHARNKGYGMSIKNGIIKASGEFIITMDADGQHKAKEARRLLDYIGQYDMVVGARRPKDNRSLRAPGKWLLKKVAEYMVGQKIPDVNSGLRLFKKGIMRKYFSICANRFSFSTSSVLCYISDNLDVKFVEIESSGRQCGRSQVRLRDGFQTLLLIVQIIMVFNPLKIFFSFFLLGAILTCGFVTFDLTFSGQISDTSVLLAITSFLVFLFGLLADQIAKIRKELVGSQG
jgi:glycosyltransferase involved in cell wall biosynthesis